MIEWKCLSFCYSSCCSNLLEAPLNEKQNICNIFNKVTPHIPQNMIKIKYIQLAWANSVLLLLIVCTLSPTHMWNCWFPWKLCWRECVSGVCWEVRRRHVGTVPLFHLNTRQCCRTALGWTWPLCRQGDSTGLCIWWFSDPNSVATVAVFCLWKWDSSVRQRERWPGCWLLERRGS